MKYDQVASYKQHVGEELVLGFLLSEENIRQIVDGLPLAVSLEGLAIDGCKVIIGYGTHKDIEKLNAGERILDARRESRAHGRAT